MKGLRRTSHGWRAYGRVNGQFFSKTFAKDTSRKVMLDWRVDERARIRAKQLAGEIDDEPQGTLGGDVPRYLEMVKAMPGLDQREFELKKWIAALGSDRPRKSITAAQLLAVMHDWRASGLSPATCNRRRTALLHLWNRLDGKSAKNPVRDVPAFNEGKAEARGRSYALLAKIFAEMMPTATRARLKMIAYCGVAHVELKRLEASDWNRRENTLRITGRSKGRGGHERRIQLTAKGVQALKELDRAKAWGWFSNSSLHARWQAAIARVNKQAEKDAKKRRRPPPPPIAHIRPYDLRHSLATEIYRLTRDLKVVKEYLGHTSLKTTERYMAGAVSDSIAAAAAAFDQAHAGKLLPMKGRKRAS